MQTKLVTNPERRREGISVRLLQSILSGQSLEHTMAIAGQYLKRHYNCQFVDILITDQQAKTLGPMISLYQDSDLDAQAPCYPARTLLTNMRGEAIGQIVLLSSVPFTDREEAFIAETALKISLALQQSHQQEELKSKIQERELLLRDVTHRAKNVFQNIMGLIQLKFQNETQGSIQETVKEIQAYIEALAGYFSMFYSGKQVENPNAAAVVSMCIDNIEQSHQEHQIKIQTEIQNLELPANTVMPLIYFINEALSNVYKHAYTTKDNGQVRISLKHANGAVFFEIEDKGKGFIPGTQESMGRTLLHSFAKQLGGEFKIDSIPGQGTNLLLVFPFEF